MARARRPSSSAVPSAVILFLYTHVTHVTYPSCSAVRETPLSSFCLSKGSRQVCIFNPPGRNASAYGNSAANMTTGMPELGSKISLISKADIRYEGRLFTVDPQECTIALASVRSFGTEDRDAQYPVPAQSQVYDYILFRGSDIKDIRVVNSVPHPQPLNDPAIMQLSVPPSLGSQAFQNHPVLGSIGPQLGQFGGGYGGIGTLGGLGATIGGGLSMQRERSMSGSKTTSVLDLIGGSRSTTPVSLGSRKSPTTDQGVQTGNAKQDDKKVIKPIQPPNQRNQSRRQSRGGENNNQNQGRSLLGRNNVPPQEAFHHRQEYHNQGGQNYHHHPNQRNNWSNNRGMRSRGRPRGTFRNPTNPNNKPKNTLRFENDFDFEQANTQFEELRSQLGKLKLEEAGSSSTTKPEVNGEIDKKDDSGNETGAGETEQDDEHEVYYDKNKSFFDKISCEAVERAKGKSQRTDWRVERKLNSETFGVAATRRGNYRGRGGFRGMHYRGGYRPNYRQPQRREPMQLQQQPLQQQQGNRQVQQNQQPADKVQVPQKDVEKKNGGESSVKGAEKHSEVAPEPAVAGILYKSFMDRFFF